MKTLIIPASILIGCIILGGFYYAVQSNKQASIEMQQRIDLAAEREKQAIAQEVAEKEFDAERKSDCLQVYTTESGKWNNVRGWRYDDYYDTCYIRYKETVAKSDAECDKIYPLKNPDGTILNMWVMENLLCKDGEFENSF